MEEGRGKREATALGLERSRASRLTPYEEKREDGSDKKKRDERREKRAKEKQGRM
jgi:hypothetical protein